MAQANKRSFIKKLILSFLTVMLLLQPLQAFAYAPILNDKNMEEKNKPGIIEKYLSKLIINVGDWLLDLSNAQDVSVLTFQRKEIITKKDQQLSNTSSADRGNMVFGIFPSGLFDGISAFNSFFTSLLPIPIVVILAGSGLFLIFDIMKSNEVRSKVKEILFGVILAVLMMRFGHILWEWIIDINYYMVDAVYVVLKDAGVTITRFTSTIWDSSQYGDLSGSKSIGVAIMLILAIGMTFTLNYQYMMRMLQIAVLIIMFPLVVLSAIMPSRKSALNLWFSTFISNVFMQAGHAIALGLFFYTLTNASSISFWLIITMLFGLPAMADVVNRLVGAFTGEGGGGGMKTSASNMSGMAGMMAISKIGSTIAGGKNRRKGSSETSESKNATGNFGKSSSSSTEGSGLSSDGGMSGGGSGVAPINSGLQTANDSGMGLKGKGLGILSKASKGVAKSSRALAQSNGARSFVRGAAIAGMAGAGAIASSMTTGNAAPGASLGSQIGRGAGAIGNSLREKVGKMGEYAGEYAGGVFDQALGKTDNPHSPTSERLGYADNAQLYDPSEMGRMGQELIGGKTGKALGTTVGAVNRFVGSAIGSPEQKVAIAKVGERRSIGQQLSDSRANQESARYELDSAKLAHNHITSQYGAHTEAGQAWAKNEKRLPHPEIQKSQQNVHEKEATFNKHAYETRQLETKQANFYHIQNRASNMDQQANDMQSLQSEVRSSGRL
ncbi:hypothetical protein [Bacillus sp. 1P06AnD]|uniref:hypothetical protein n=1 Tax=Bacillus sp. 1P06AnD TaxID=3132208 RepID=UPI0039A384D0